MVKHIIQFVYACPRGEGVFGCGFCVLIFVSVSFLVVRITVLLEGPMPLYEGLFVILICFIIFCKYTTFSEMKEKKQEKVLDMMYMLHFSGRIRVSV